MATSTVVDEIAGLTKVGGYTCPMHPEVRAEMPGACPKCGMALEPLVPVTVVAHLAKYTCPMDPQIVQDGPGACPLCGMALEPLEVTAATPEGRRSGADQHDAALLDCRRTYASAVGIYVYGGDVAYLGVGGVRVGYSGVCCGPAGPFSSAGGRRW